MVGPVVVVVFLMLIAMAIGLGALWVGHVEAVWGAEAIAADIGIGGSPAQGFSFGVLRDVTWSIQPVSVSGPDAPGAASMVVVHADLGGFVPVTSAVALEPPSQLGTGPA